jgi:hypothetical protein
MLLWGGCCCCQVGRNTPQRLLLPHLLLPCWVRGPPMAPGCTVAAAGWQAYQPAAAAAVGRQPGVAAGLGLQHPSLHAAAVRLRWHLLSTAARLCCCGPQMLPPRPRAAAARLPSAATARRPPAAAAAICSSSRGSERQELLPGCAPQPGVVEQQRHTGRCQGSGCLGVCVCVCVTGVMMSRLL